MNILLTGCFNYSPDQINTLKSISKHLNFYYMQYENGQLPIEYEKVNAVICNGLFLYHDLECFPNLQFIQLVSAGYDRVPVDKIKERGILLFNAKGVYSIPMSEWALFRVLEFFKCGWSFRNQQLEKEWTKNRNLREIYGSKVAIVGAGNVGQEVAKLFQALGAETTGFDVHTNETTGFDNMLLTENLHNSISKFDIIILTAPLLPSTKGIIDRKILETMKTNSIIVNIARGALIDQKALTNVLSARKDIFAALDVFEEEPLEKSSKLWEMDNVAISPHNSFVGDGNNKRMFEVILVNLKDFLGLA